MKTAIVIPARMASTRFPGKPLIDLCGKPMIQWVYEAALKSQLATQVVVATPDHEILDACKKFGAEGILTRFDHPSGTDRIAEVAEKLKADVYVNVQGDEPLISPLTIDDCIKPLLEDETVLMGSMYSTLEEDEVENPAVVKVVTDVNQFALYFSRYPIPFPRNPRQIPLKKHVGIYAYRDVVLGQFAKWTQTPLEACESLEQLRFLENGIRIKMSEGSGSVVGIDTPDQAEQVRRMLS